MTKQRIHNLDNVLLGYVIIGFPVYQRSHARVFLEDPVEITAVLEREGVGNTFDGGTFRNQQQFGFFDFSADNKLCRRFTDLLVKQPDEMVFAKPDVPGNLLDLEILHDMGPNVFQCFSDPVVEDSLHGDSPTEELG